MASDMQMQSGQSAASARMPTALTDAALRGAGQMFDMQLSAMRTLMQTQARAAAAFGFPDCSAIFKNDGEQPQREVIAKSTEAIASVAQTASDTFAEVQRRVAGIVESQTQVAAQSWQQGIEQLSTETDESLKTMRETFKQQSEELERATQAAAEEARQGGERMRQQMHEGAQKGKETLAQLGEAGRQQTESIAKSAPAGADEKQKRERSA